MIKLCLKTPTKATKPTMNHFSLFVNLLGWRSLGPAVPNAHAEVSSCSLDMANHSLMKDVGCWIWGLNRSRYQSPFVIFPKSIPELSDPKGINIIRELLPNRLALVCVKEKHVSLLGWMWARRRTGRWSIVTTLWYILVTVRLQIRSPTEMYIRGGIIRILAACREVFVRNQRKHHLCNIVDRVEPLNRFIGIWWHSLCQSLEYVNCWHFKINDVISFQLFDLNNKLCILRDQETYLCARYGEQIKAQVLQNEALGRL